MLLGSPGLLGGVTSAARCVGGARSSRFPALLGAGMSPVVRDRRQSGRR